MALTLNEAVAVSEPNVAPAAVTMPVELTEPAVNEPPTTADAAAVMAPFVVDDPAVRAPVTEEDWAVTTPPVSKLPTTAFPVAVNAPPLLIAPPDSNVVTPILFAVTVPADKAPGVLTDPMKRLFPPTVRRPLTVNAFALMVPLLVKDCAVTEPAVLMPLELKRPVMTADEPVNAPALSSEATDTWPVDTIDAAVTGPVVLNGPDTRLPAMVTLRPTDSDPDVLKKPPNIPVPARILVAVTSAAEVIVPVDVMPPRPVLTAEVVTGPSWRCQLQSVSPQVTRLWQSLRPMTTLRTR